MFPRLSNFERLYTFVEAKRAQAEDDLLMLKESPDFFDQSSQRN